MRSASSRLLDDVLYRFWVGVLGTVIGPIFGAFALLPLSYFGVVSTSPGRWFGAAAIAGAVTGVLLPERAIAALQVLVHFLWGLIVFLVQGVGSEPPQSHPRSLVVAFVFGALYAAALFLF